jgi:hypothetical protein
LADEFDLTQFSPAYLWDMQLFAELSVAAVNHLTSHYGVLADHS